MSIDLPKTVRRRGFTLLEMMVALGISSIILAVICSFILYTGRSFAALSNYVELNQKSMQALDVITRELRQAQQVLDISSDTIQVKDVNGQNLTIKFFGPDDALYPRQVVMIGASGAKVLLEDCDSFTARGFRRVPGENHTFFEVEQTADASLVKMIQIDWECYRDVFVGDKRTTESVQTAKVVLRYNPMKTL